MKPIRLGTLSAVATLLLGVGSALAAHQAHFPTTIGYGGPFAPEDFHGVYYGSIDSPHRACVAGRTVKLYIKQGGSLVLTDTDKTSHKGVWAAHTPSFDEGKVKVTSKEVGRPHHRSFCQGESLVLD
jgi:hypothetical protein